MIVDLSDDNVSFLIEIIRRLMPKKTDSQAAGALHDDESMLNYGGEVVLVGINYEVKKKVHSCVIERV